MPNFIGAGSIQGSNFVDEGRRQRVERILHETLERPAVDRGAYLSEACRGEPDLRSEVQAMLAARSKERSSSEDSVVGKTFGTYEIVDKLGEGGMGEVYRARDTKLRRDVAIKLLPAELAEGGKQIERMHREARMLAAIDHPYINAIYAVEEVHGLHFLVLQLVEGETLAARLAEGPIPVEESLRIALKVSEALEAAHAKGIVHRDLKPSNVMVTGEDSVKVLDFGIAKEAQSLSSAGETEEATRSRLTAAGSIVGTVPYMSPEQLRGESVTAATDVWAFGCLLYEMLADRPAFPGATAADTSAAVLTREPDWSGLETSVPTAVVDLMRQCLHKVARERLQSIAEGRAALTEALSQFASSGSRWANVVRSGAEAIGPRSRPFASLVRGWRAFLVGAATLAVAVAIYRWGATGSSPSPSEDPFQISNQVLATIGPGAHTAPTLSPDGSTVAFVSDASGGPRIWVQTLTEGAEPIPITGEDAPALHPSWSPTNDQIAFHRPGDGIWTVGPLGTPAPRRILEEGINPSFSWDGRRIVYERFPEIWIANVDGTDPRVVEGGNILMPELTQAAGEGYPAFSPDGESIVYFRMVAGPWGDFWIVPSVGGAPRRLTFDPSYGSHPVWTPDGEHVIFSSQRSGSRTLWRVAASGGEPEPVTSGAGEDNEPVISRDGRRLVYSNVRNLRALMIYDPELGDSQEIVARRYGLIYPRFSPDGETIVFFGEVAGGTEIFLVGADGTGMRQLTTGRQQLNVHPRWSADGSTVYFYRDYLDREGVPGEFLKVSTDGGAGEVLLRDFSWDRNMAADVHPDGRRVAFLSVEGLPANVSTIVKDSQTGEEKIWSTVLTQPYWSHDGNYLVGSDMSGAGFSDRTIWLCTSDDECESVTNGVWPVWSGDDSELYFFRAAATPWMREIWVVDRNGSNARLVTEIGPLDPFAPNFDVAPDGRIVWTQSRPGSSELWSADIDP